MTVTRRAPAHDFSLDPDAMLREGDAAALVGFTPRALQDWRRRGVGPRFVKVSSRGVRYRKKDLLEWCASKVHASTSDPGRCAEAAER
jgi:predicted DNA-binding transcriptional regulator AlpA